MHDFEDYQRQLNRSAVLASIAINNAIQVSQREQALNEQIREKNTSILSEVFAVSLYWINTWTK